MHTVCKSLERLQFIHAALRHQRCLPPHTCMYFTRGPAGSTILLQQQSPDGGYSLAASTATHLPLDASCCGQPGVECLLLARFFDKHRHLLEDGLLSLLLRLTGRRGLVLSGRHGCFASCCCSCSMSAPRPQRAAVHRFALCRVGCRERCREPEWLSQSDGGCLFLLVETKQTVYGGKQESDLDDLKMDF